MVFWADSKIKSFPGVNQQETYQMIKKIKKLTQHHKPALFSLTLILLLATFLRFYKLRDSVIFLGDEGRDALAVKRILLDRDPTLLGPTASVGGFYLGPVYYYMIAPFFLLFGMDPVGGAVMVALMGVVTVALMFVLLYRWFGLFPAGIASAVYAASPGVIRFSRSSWNPNPMPFFTLLTLIAMHYLIKQKKPIIGLLAGLFFGIIIQLHYLGLIVSIYIGLMTLLHLPKNHWAKTILFETLGFLIGSSLLIAFELRHNFLNTRAVFEFITRSGGAARPKSWNFPWLFTEVNRFNIESVLGKWSAEVFKNLPFGLAQILTYILFLAVIIYLVNKLKTKQKFSLAEKTIFTFWISLTLGLSLYRGQWHYHYFEVFFLAPYLLIGLILSSLKPTSAKLSVAMLTLLTIVFVIPKSPTWAEGSKLLDQTKRISQKAIDLSQGKPYNFALITDGNSDHAYRFFLELEGATPTPLNQRVEKQLIIICEKYPPETCAPLGNPLWEIAGFGRAQIEQQIEVFPNTTLYRLVHHPDSIDQIGKPASQG